MRMARMPVVRSWLLLSTVGLHVAGADEVAIIYGLTGQAFVKTRSAAERRPAQRFEWLPAEAEIEVGEGATLLLAFASGTRYELRGGSKAALSASGAFRSSSGPVKALASVSPLPRLESFAADTRQGGRAGALRIRGSRIDGLYPRDPASVLPHESILSFEPLPGTLRLQGPGGGRGRQRGLRCRGLRGECGRLPGRAEAGGPLSLDGAQPRRQRRRPEARPTSASSAPRAWRREKSCGARSRAWRIPRPWPCSPRWTAGSASSSRRERGFRAALAKRPADATLQAALEKRRAPDRRARTVTRGPGALVLAGLLPSSWRRPRRALPSRTRRLRRRPRRKPSRDATRATAVRLSREMAAAFEAGETADPSPWRGTLEELADASGSDLPGPEVAAFVEEQLSAVPRAAGAGRGSGLASST